MKCPTGALDSFNFSDYVKEVGFTNNEVEADTSRKNPNFLPVEL